MSTDHPYLLYVGDEQRGQRLQAQAGLLDWPVQITSETMDALAAYIFSYPDVIVLDAAADPATMRAVFWH